MLALLFPPTWRPGDVHSCGRRASPSEGEIEAARHEGERARDWAWYSVGIGLSVYIVLFLVWLLRHQTTGAVRKVFFDGRP